MKKSLLWMSSLTLLISGCVSPYVNPPYSAVTSPAAEAGGVTGMALGAAAAVPAEALATGSVVGAAAGIGFGAYLVSTPRILKILQEDGVQVVQVGNGLRVIIPSDRLFAPGSTYFEPGAYKVLDDVAMFLMRYGDVPLRIYAFSDNVYDSETAQKITSAQSRQVGGYFWSKGRPFFHVTPSGMSNRYAVSSNGNPYGSYYNRRIEIIMPVVQPKMRFVRGVTKSLDVGDY